MEDVNPPSRRDAQAQATRRTVVEAATALFLEQGYAATTIDQVAARAGVSRPTVFSVGSKAALLAAARDVALAGDDEQVAVAARESAQRVLHERDPHRLLALLAEHVSGVQERYARLDEVLQAAAAGDAELAALWRTSEQQRQQGARMFLDALASRTRLALPEQDAVDVLWLLMASDVQRRLVRDRGWPRERYVAWLADTLRAVLLPRQG